MKEFGFTIWNPAKKKVCVIHSGIICLCSFRRQSNQMGLIGGNRWGYLVDQIDLPKRIIINRTNTYLGTKAIDRISDRQGRGKKGGKHELIRRKRKKGNIGINWDTEGNDVIRDFRNNTTPVATKEAAGGKRRRPADSPPPTTDPFYSDSDPGDPGWGRLKTWNRLPTCCKAGPPPRSSSALGKIDMPYAIVRSLRCYTTAGLSWGHTVPSP